LSFCPSLSFIKREEKKVSACQKTTRYEVGLLGAGPLDRSGLRYGWGLLDRQVPCFFGLFVASGLRLIDVGHVSFVYLMLLYVWAGDRAALGNARAGMEPGGVGKRISTRNPATILCRRVREELIL
jgi:hypothetical protein